ncbi:hypothetical protein N7509_006804 [Penicillium cosmopolitanum]|uniref:Histone chaperone domain-containing protein n=1 Tax=Penicillium cosmopolitanum TaxID=1131564 RepID=A0A9W9VXQ1_9EURO|nr:uncharacterized protein N7509_006804 [Penicillium cosmopolitanum]KAJ5391314.1 hypothetical protein N7509_006804 [Penicillium cosmopolitanum]
MPAQEPIEVVDDEDAEGFEEVDDEFANSSQQLDEDEAIDQSNIMNDRTRHAQPQTSSWYSEANEDDLPEETL